MAREEYHYPSSIQECKQTSDPMRPAAGYAQLWTSVIFTRPQSGSVRSNTSQTKLIVPNPRMNGRLNKMCVRIQSVRDFSSCLSPALFLLLSSVHTQSFVFSTQHLARSNLRWLTLSLKPDSTGPDLLLKQGHTGTQKTHTYGHTVHIIS